MHSLRQFVSLGASECASQVSDGRSICSKSERRESPTHRTVCACVKKPPPVRCSKSCSANDCTSGQDSTAADGPVAAVSSLGGRGTPMTRTPRSMAIKERILWASTASTSSFNAASGVHTCSRLHRDTSGCIRSHRAVGAYRRTASFITMITASSRSASARPEPKTSRPFNPDSSHPNASREPAWFLPSTPPNRSKPSRPSAPHTCACNARRRCRQWRTSSAPIVSFFPPA